MSESSRQSRDKEVLVAVLRAVGGGAVADAHPSEKGATLKRLIADHLTGANGRPKAERWVPRWMAFPPAAYAARGGVAAVAAARRVKWLVECEGGEAEVADNVEPSPVAAPDLRRAEPWSRETPFRSPSPAPSAASLMARLAADRLRPWKASGRNGAGAAIFRRTLTRSLHRETK